MLYTFQHFLLQADDSLDNEIEAVPIRRLNQQFLWHSVKDDVNSSNVKVTTCRNSVQGKVLIVDDRGKYQPAGHK